MTIHRGPFSKYCSIKFPVHTADQCWFEAFHFYNFWTRWREFFLRMKASQWPFCFVVHQKYSVDKLKELLYRLLKQWTNFNNPVLLYMKLDIKLIQSITCQVNDLICLITFGYKCFFENVSMWGFLICHDQCHVHSLV